MKKNLFVLLLLVAISAIAFGSTFLYVKLNEQTDDSDFLIMTSCNPVYIATLNVAEDVDGVSVQNLSQPTTGCLHDYSLTTEDMKSLSKADVLVVSGGGMEGYLDDVMAAYPNLPILDASAAIALEREGDEANSHYWLSLDDHETAVSNIAAGLSKLDQDNEATYTKNAEAYISKLEEALGQSRNSLKNEMSGQSVAILHEAYAYIAQDLSLNIAADMDLDEERQVSAGEIADLVDAIEDEEVSIVFAEEDYGKSVGDLLEEQTSAKVVYLNTLIHGNFGKDSYIEEMQKNYTIIEEALND